MLAEGDTSGAQHAVLGWNGDGWDVDMPDGSVYVYGDHKPLQQIRDRHGNTLSVIREFPEDDGQGTGNVTDVVSPNGRWLHYTYDSNDVHATSVTDSSGRTVSYGYDDTGHLTTVTDPMGRTTTYGYDTSGRMTTIKDGRSITYLTNVYGAADRVTQQSFADGSTIHFSWSVASSGILSGATVTDAAGVVHSYTYDSGGYLTKSVDGAGTTLAQTTSYTRDPITHLPTSAVDPVNRTSTVTYDADGNIATTVAAKGTADQASTTSSYAGTPFADEASSITDPLGRVTKFGYDLAGDTTSVTDPSGRVSASTFDADGLPLTSTDPGLAAATLAWADGDLTHLSAPGGSRRASPTTTPTGPSQ